MLCSISSTEQSKTNAGPALMKKAIRRLGGLKRTRRSGRFERKLLRPKNTAPPTAVGHPRVGVSRNDGCTVTEACLKPPHTHFSLVPGTTGTRRRTVEKSPRRNRFRFHRSTPSDCLSRQGFFFRNALQNCLDLLPGRVCRLV